jgi:SAM-dependent MidA family methyltransferase
MARPGNPHPQPHVIWLREMSPDGTSLCDVLQMVGIWAVTVWQALGSPPAFRLVELGPGRGTLMADALRGTAPLRSFADALSVHFVEVGLARSTLQEHRQF